MDRYYPDRQKKKKSPTGYSAVARICILHVHRLQFFERQLLVTRFNFNNPYDTRGHTIHLLRIRIGTQRKQNSNDAKNARRRYFNVFNGQPIRTRTIIALLIMIINRSFYFFFLYTHDDIPV